jgi:hypothetical protein
VKIHWPWRHYQCRPSSFRRTPTSSPITVFLCSALANAAADWSRIRRCSWRCFLQICNFKYASTWRSLIASSRAFATFNAPSLGAHAQPSLASAASKRSMRSCSVFRSIATSRCSSSADASKILPAYIASSANCSAISHSRRSWSALRCAFSSSSSLAANFRVETSIRSLESDT